LFLAKFEDAMAPATCAKFRPLMPFEDQLIHARWSGEACWIPLGGRDLGINYENATSYPAPGQVIVYPGGVNETEILLAYGPTRFASKTGAACGQPFSDDPGRSRSARTNLPLGSLARRDTDYAAGCLIGRIRNVWFCNGLEGAEHKDTVGMANRQPNAHH
jgi:Protein of unknown function (DUF3830)